jgi:dTDP-D-glucose 4,6-dehydratase
VTKELTDREQVNKLLMANSKALQLATEGANNESIFYTVSAVKDNLLGILKLLQEQSLHKENMEAKGR